jgi:hypothetical protein
MLLCVAFSAAEDKSDTISFSWEMISISLKFVFDLEALAFKCRVLSFVKQGWVAKLL